VVKNQGRDLPRSLQRLIKSGVDLLFPPRCAGCGMAEWDWCPTCDSSLQRLVRPLCHLCGTPQRLPVSRCDRCELFSDRIRIRSYAWYQGTLMQAILQLKYRPNRRLAKIMANWLVPLYEDAHGAANLICAVPLGKQRMKERGYNQAELIAEELADTLGLPESGQVLKRTRETISQVGLDPHSRRKNVKDAFKASEKVQNQRIVLVDDLFTTGATLAACSDALLNQGAKDILALTVARA
jgi:ComF family protein